MVSPLLIGTGAQIIGGLFGASSAKRAAQKAAAARKQQANTVYDSSRFRPVGMTSRFGSSNFEQDANGNITGASYELDPQLAGFQDYMLQQAGGYGMDYANQTNDQVQGLFNLGQGYLAESPEQAAQRAMGLKQNLVAPGRERALAGVRNNLFNSGRGGLSVGATGMRPDGSAGLGASNPEMEAYYNALAQQDAGFATQASQEGMDQARFGASLFGTGQNLQSGALNPFSSFLRGASDIENLARQPYQQSLELAQMQASINGNARNNWANIMNGANQASQQANSINPFATAVSAAGRQISGMNFGGNAPPPYIPYNSETTIPMQFGGGY